jgi:hypothetical protein
MAATGVSEFTFAFAFLFEQTRSEWGNLSVAPILPSLNREAELGWDARLPVMGQDYYYQFKLSERLSRWNAKYLNDGTYQAPYFRISLHRRHGNRQHRQLMDHAATHPETYYVAPEFSGLDQFNAAFLDRQIVAQSRLIPLRDCEPIYDGDQHHITFQSDKRGWKQHSQAAHHEYSVFGRELGVMYEKARSHWEAIDTGYAKHLFDSTVARIQRQYGGEASGDRSVLRLLDLGPTETNRIGYLLKASEILWAFYGLTLVLAGDPAHEG